MKENHRAGNAREGRADPVLGPPTPGVLAPGGVSSGHRWLFRLLAAVVVLLPLVLLELILRAGGFGHPTSFFVPREIGGKAVLVENTWFGLSFFPPALARSPSPVVMQAVKPPGVCRIFLFGESAAMGDPRPAYGVGRCLEALLRARFPQTEFEVVCVAMTAINSHAILPIARECARYQGDLWIIYMGNNEFTGPFGANTVFGPQAPSNRLVRGYLALQRTRTGQLLVTLARWLNHGGNAPDSWGGMRMFLGAQLSPADPRKEKVYASFRRNLEDILQVARRAGVPVVLSSVACNLKDCAPFASMHTPALEGPRRAEWERRFQTGLTNLDRGDFAQALEEYRAAAELSPLYAEGHFRLGQCLLAMKHPDAAAQSFRRARDLDALPFRADTAINRIIREVAGRYEDRRVVFLDAEQALEPLSASGVAGEECFYEHVHLNFEGNYQLARALAEKTAGCLPRKAVAGLEASWEARDAHRDGARSGSGVRTATGPRSQQPGLQARFGIMAPRIALRPAACRDGARSGSEVRTATGPRSQQPGWQAGFGIRAPCRALRPAARRDGARSELAGPEASWEAPEACARDLGLTDWNRYTILEEIERRIAEAPFINQAGHAAALWNLETRLAECRGRLRPQALQAAHLTYQQAITRHPQDHWLHHNYAEFLAAIGSLAQATEQMRKVCELVPQHYSAHLQLGRLLARQGQFEAAAGALKAALGARPGSGEIYLELGQLCASQGRLDEALVQYALARRCHGDQPRLCLLRAQALEQQKKRTEAVQSLREATRLRPDYCEAHELLGVELGLQGNYPEAGREFEEVVRLRPDQAEGHLNLGIALARQARFDEALAHLETARRLEPRNEKARDFIEAIKQRKASQ